MLDEIDLKILHVLQSEGRIPLLELADRAGLSATPCARRVKHMEEAGIIQSYVALLSPEALGLHLTALINVRLRHSKEWQVRFEEAVKKMNRVVGCYVTTGSFDYLLRVLATDIDDLSTWTREHLITAPGIAHTHTSIVMGVVKHSTILPLSVGSVVASR